MTKRMRICRNQAQPPLSNRQQLSTGLISFKDSVWPQRLFT